MIMAGRGRHLENTNSEPKKVGNLQISPKNTSVDMLSVINKIIEVDTSNINRTLLMNIQSMFKQLFASKEVMRDVLSNLHTKALAHSEFGEKLVLALEQIYNLEVDGTLVRDEILFFIQSDFKAKETMAQSDPKKLVNSVLLLGNVYDTFKVCGEPISILGMALLEYFNLLIKGDEKELKVLTKQILINGTKLSHLENYDILAQNLRTTLLTKDLNFSSKCWILLTIDLMSNDSKSLKGALRDFYLQNLGEEYTNLESFISIQNNKLIRSSNFTDSVKSQDSTCPGSKNLQISSPSKTDGLKKDLSRKFSDMNVKPSRENKEKISSLPIKNNKKDIYKLSGGPKGSSGHDDRFEKDENFYGAQKPREPKSFNQKKKFNSDGKITKKGNEDFKTDVTKLEPQMEDNSK